jgi:sugar lactone lactonase YvrE
MDMRRFINFRTALALHLLALLVIPTTSFLSGRISQEMIAEPEIIRVDPDVARLEGGVRVTVTGRNFSQATEIVVGDAPAKNIHFVSSTEIRFVVPPQKFPGERTLSIRTAAGMAQRKFVILPRPFSEVAPGEITTVAGGLSYVGDGGKAVDAFLNHPYALAADERGNLYFCDPFNYRIRRIDNRTGIITTVAGNGLSGSSDDGIPATTASFNSSLYDLVLDKTGNIFFIDGSRVRRIDAVTGILTTVAGSRERGYTGDGGPADRATLYFPHQLAIDREGNLFIGDGENHVVRRIDAETGIITTVAGNGESGSSGDGGPALEASIDYIIGLAVDSSGNLFIADKKSATVRRVDSKTGIITTVAGNGSRELSGEGGPATSAGLGWALSSIALDRFENLYIGLHNSILRVDARTGKIETMEVRYEEVKNGDRLAILNYVEGMVFDIAGNLFLADSGNNFIRRIDAGTRKITKVAGVDWVVTFKQRLLGDGGPAIRAAVTSPTGIAADNVGNIFFTELFNHRVRRIDATTRIITTVAGKEPGLPKYFNLQGEGDFSGDGGPALEARLNLPQSIAFDKVGNLFIFDEGNCRIRRVDKKSGIINTVAGCGCKCDGPIGDGGPATEVVLDIKSGSGDIVLDNAGNLYIADGQNKRIRRVDARTRIITTVAGNGSKEYSGDNGPAVNAGINPTSIAIDGAGNLFIVDISDHRVRRVDAKTGIITTVAGKGGTVDETLENIPAKDASIFPLSIALDRAGNLFILSSKVHRVDAATGIITRVAGKESYSFLFIDGVKANSVDISAYKIAIDAAGNLFITESQNTIRVVKGIAK